MAALLLTTTIAGCTTPSRLPAVPNLATTSADLGMGPIRFLAVRDPQPFADEALASVRKEQAYLVSQGHQGPLPPASYLAISGGGDNGAFGAGLLNGWTKAGTRPEFKAVTGVSTGALIAPFAFLGSEYDPVLKTVYTTISGRDIFKRRGLMGGLFGDAAADSKPLAQLVARFTDQKLLDAIAAEYAKGRLLLVGTTNLDALEPVIWNMTAIAASKDSRAPELFRKILVASASIPGAFPPVMIDVTVDGIHYQEMHVDGGTMSQVFLYPPSVGQRFGATGMQRQRTLYIIRNARLDSGWASVQRRTIPVATRAIGSLTLTQGVGDLYRIFLTAQRDGLEYNLASIPGSFNAPHPAEFDTEYMRQLFAVGEDMAAAGYPWEKHPPGYQPRP